MVLLGVLLAAAPRRAGRVTAYICQMRTVIKIEQGVLWGMRHCGCELQYFSSGWVKYAVKYVICHNKHI